jgi:hypothetical protein
MRVHYKPTMDAATKNAVPKNGDTKIQERGFVSSKGGVIIQDWLHEYHANTKEWTPIKEIREGMTREEILSRQSTTNNHNPQSLVQKKTLPSTATTAKAMMAINSKKAIELEQEKQILHQKQQKRKEMDENLQQCRIDSSKKYPDGVAPGCYILGGRRRTRRRKQKSSRRQTTTRKRPKRSRAKRSTKRRRPRGRK